MSEGVTFLYVISLVLSLNSQIILIQYVFENTVYFFGDLFSSYYL